MRLGFREIGVGHSRRVGLAFIYEDLSSLTRHNVSSGIRSFELVPAFIGQVVENTLY